MKVCAELDCPELTNTTRCNAHTRFKDRARGTRQQRGYDARYERQRKRDARTVAAGLAICWSCSKRISPLEPWDEGHCELDRSVIHGPQHRACNRDTSQPGCAHHTHMRISPDA